MDSDRVTRNREALLLENAALRAEVAALREELRRLRSRGRLDGLSGAAARVTTGMAPAITTEQVREWLEGLARQSGWTRLRAEALRTLVTARRGSDARGELEDELDRTIDRSLALLGPLIILALSVFVGFIIVSLMSAVISINDLAI